MTNDLNTLLICPVCNNKYLENDIRTVANKKDSVIVHVTCNFCLSASLAMISTANGTEGLVTMGMLTDLSYGEALETIKREPITADEVIELNRIA